MANSPRKPLETEGVELASAKQPRPSRVAVSRRGMVSSAHFLATQAGVRVLEEGGNAVDAAVATAFALGVCEPAASGLGGQTMMLIFDAESKRKIALDGSSRAPHRAIPQSLSAAERRRGYKACTVPSTPATLDYARKRYGRLKLSQLLAPAIEMAENGCPVTELQHALTSREREHLRKGTAGTLFLIKGKRVPSVGYRLKQPILAQTLRRLARYGIKSFYTGRIARLVEEDMVRNDGLIRRDDLAQIPWPLERRPVSGAFRGCRLFTMPPPGAGRTLIEMLNILGHFKPNQYDPETPRGAVLLAKIIRRAFLDREDRPFDPNFYSQVATKQMLASEYAEKLARQLRKQIKSRGETTHLSVMDREGNAVALTQSIENVYGSCQASPELGFLYNNYMSAFDYNDISHPYHMRPNAVPWASVAPTIVFRGRKPWLAIGSPGSQRITPSILQVLIRLLAGRTPFAAVDAPRLFCSLNGKVSLEAARMRDDIPEALVRHGLDVDVRDPYSFYLGCVQLVACERNVFTGVADPRRDGSPGAPKAP